MSTVEQYEARFGLQREAAQILADREVIAHEFDGNTVSKADIWQGIPDDLLAHANDEEYQQAVEGVLARPGVWKLDGNHLAFVFTDPDSGMMHQLQVDLAPGTVIDNTAAALQAAAAADAGLRHTIVEGEVVGEKTPIGSLFSSIGNSMRWVESRNPKRSSG